MGTVEMSDYDEYRLYLLSLGEDNSVRQSRLRRNLGTAVSEELTSRQKDVLYRFFMEGQNMTHIARELGVAVSTVSRTLKRGRERLHKCLKYGAAELLPDDER